ncbi:rhodanese-like domain-containing protein [Haloarchaeobius litoreus]|uniref:Rhodanese-like domain-containing protein n=1 Tax=Haloarchaeobius litoreus TaxID=755306 RepID=A0ABD6DFD2_9EURY|nr:rhodanese-like domain-containing protein [Haloarchaeobius litoreus]
MDGEIRPEDVKGRLDDGDDPLVVDIRSELAFERGHIPGSTNLPFQRLPSEVDRVAGHDHVVTVCPHGKSSVQAARLIASYEGFDGTVESMAGGLTAWEWELERAEAAEEAGDAPF